MRMGNTVCCFTPDRNEDERFLLNVVDLLSPCLPNMSELETLASVQRPHARPKIVSEE